MASRVNTPTIVGGAIQTCISRGIPHVVEEYTTLNQALNEPTIISNLPSPPTRGMDVLPAYDPLVDTNNLKVQYICIGNRGHRSIVPGGNEVDYTDTVEHLATDTGLYGPIPFIIRPVNSDLSIAERKQYRLRRTIFIDGVMYAAYYARKYELDRVSPTMQITKIINGQETSVEFIPNMSNLHPTPPTEDVDYEGSYAEVLTPMTLEFNAQEIAEIKNACRILFGTENSAIISEIAFCSGADKPIEKRYPAEGPQNPTNVAANTFFEVVACQVVMFISTYVPIRFEQRHYKADFDLGASEPLLGVRVAD